MLPEVSSFLTKFASATTLASLACFPAQAETTVAGQPSGVMSAQLPLGANPLSFPLIGEEVFAGIVSSNTNAAVTFVEGDLAGALSAGVRYYLEVVTGPMEGDRLDLASANGSVAMLNLSSSSHSTVAALSEDLLNGARIVVRRHVTLKDLSGMFTPSLVGHNSAARADQIQVYQNGGLTTYYLRGDGVSWRQPGKTVDQSDVVIPPDSSILVDLKSGAKRWLHAGGVRTNAFRVNLVAGTRAFATGFPVDLSFSDIGATSDPQLPVATRWVGSDSAVAADTFQIYSSTAGKFDMYHLRGDGATWSPAGSAENVTEEKLLAGRGMLLLKRNNADSDYLVLRPYTL